MEYASYPSLRGRVVLVTGGASGIGEKIVEQFARQGARVVFLDIQKDAGMQLAEEDRGGRRCGALLSALRSHRHRRTCESA